LYGERDPYLKNGIFPELAESGLNITSSKIYLKNNDATPPKRNPFNPNMNKVLIEVMDIGS